VFVQQVSHTVSCQGSTADVPEKGLVGGMGPNELTKGGRGLRPQRADTLFASFAQKPNLSMANC